MSALNGNPGTASAARLLTRHALASLLKRHRLPRYQALRERLEAYYWAAVVTNLRREVFGAYPRRGSLFEMLTGFAAELDARCFPMDLGYMDMVFNSAGDVIEPFRGPVPYYGYGVAWEAEPFVDLAEADKPMVAMLLPYISAGYVDYDAVMDWWNAQGQVAPDYNSIEWPHYSHRAVRVLEFLPAPFDGLATLYDCVRKESGNPFLDTPDMMWRFEYNWGDFWWDAEDIGQLQWHYEQVRDRLQDLARYRDWFEAQGDAAGRKVAELLLSIEGRNW